MHSQTRCLNHGTISNGRVIVILPFDDSSQPSEDDDDFDLPYGTRLKYTCDDGFVLVGEDTLRCGSDSYWTESVPECVGETPASQETCRHPGVDVNGRINNLLVDPRIRRQGFPVGTELTFVCNDGFEPEGETVLVCLRNGQWTSLPPKCRRNPTAEVIELPCRHPGVVINSMFNGDLSKSSFPVGTAVTFRCIEGTQRKGPMTIFCQRNGKWSETPPSCEPTRNSKR
ncbi:Sushi, von Willebrand factor type A, EGF and pentraxin domain-containing protein 1 [Araneus ventricosus]|uniref:Sushi, von Willebrand factor type A, EGF and pentraxin domain-containing protein 1 n=1 Tax=Araneus ventricosus TaxID=182803 RepID=A0A4Y2UZ70_ARAVE|nr:Sushi, von Willebrand factor type A, EGF and pentraxin domain-containing protein 1 [Araneus ventricosus]GBO16854.1 Sushi, von Willebrand factor type A, EGF and pentraxin domain-containing protein 1 [Araneus ventricosus]